MPIANQALSEDAPYRKLVTSAANGDRQAFDSLLRRHEAELRSFLRHRAGPEEAEDLFQDVWLAAWTSIKTYSGRCRFKAWLYSIAVFKVRDLYRRRVRDQIWLSGSPAAESAMSADPAETEVLKHWVREALDSLTPDQRQLLELYYFAQLTLPEIARVLNKALSVVKYQFYRAHREVADTMNGTKDVSRGHVATAQGRR